MLRRVNIGCGQSPIEGWSNYDNSLSVRLSAIPFISKIGLISQSQADYITYVRNSRIEWADATKHIPEKDNSVEVLYSSHMLEHLDRKEAKAFLKESRRVLIHGGIIRLALPDLRYHIENYLNEKNADKFIENLLLTKEKPTSLVGQFKEIIIGDRHHMWMYDGDSLCNLLLSSGYKNAQIMEPGSTMIKDPGTLDLKERSPESLFVEAINP